MKNLVLMLLFVATSAWAQKTQNRAIGDFKALKVSQSIIVNYTQSKENSLVINISNEDYLQYVITEVDKQGTLSIRLELPKKLFNNKKFKETVEVTLSGGPLELIGGSTSAKINIQSPVQGKKLDVRSTTSARVSLGKVEVDNLLIKSSTSGAVAGNFKVSDTAILSASTSGRINVELLSGALEVDATTSGKIELNGSAKQVDASASTSGRIDGTSFTSQKLFAEASTSGSMKMKVTELLSASATTSGKISYTGSPVIEKQSKKTGGSITGN